MRTFAAVLLVGFVVAPLAAADKPEDKAKEAAVALLKAVKAKDVDAVMKVSAAPFLVREDGKMKVLKDTDSVKAWVKDKLDQIQDADKVPTEIAKITPFADLKVKLDTENAKLLDEVLGKDGFVAGASADGQQLVILVRLDKDGKAKVVGIGR